MTAHASPGVARYRALVAQWMAARERAGVAWTRADEVAHVSEVDLVWVTLSEAEQGEIEAQRRP